MKANKTSNKKNDTAVISNVLITHNFCEVVLAFDVFTAVCPVFIEVLKKKILL